jgi:ADP-ribose pyrophosphatase YjhB (NUDIX family)
MILVGEEIRQLTSFIRAGIIPYTIKNNELFFLLARDRKTLELTDFGGGIKKNETLFSAAIRELNEESCCIFQNIITPDTLSTSIAITNHSFTHVIFFVEVSNTWLLTANKFFRNSISSFQQKEFLENVSILWIHWKKLFYIIRTNSSPKLWEKLRRFLMLHPPRHLYKYIMVGCEV